jgi:hypothetical protein
MAGSDVVVSARKFGSLYGYEVNGDAEVDLESANKWVHSVLNDYKQLEESAHCHNHFELIDPEALATLAEYLYDMCEYKLPMSFLSNISVTGQTEAQQSAQCAWIITWLEGLIQASATSKGLTVVQAFKALPKCKPTGLNPDGMSRYLPGDVMKLNQQIKTVEKGFTPEGLRPASLGAFVDWVPHQQCSVRSGLGGRGRRVPMLCSVSQHRGLQPDHKGAV